MKYNRLGSSDLLVSELCLGTMTFGQQNDMEDARRQLDYARDHQINFIDTAEMYPIPAKAETQGATEEFIGQWLVKQSRSDLILATKIAGPSRRLDWIRPGGMALNRENFTAAIEASLRRLQTDYIDLYQLHWPDRYVPMFGQAEYDVSQQRRSEAIAHQLEVLADLIKAGKIRYIGLSNETPWGITQFCNVANQMNLPKIISVQNAFNLLNRMADPYLAEACSLEGVNLLAYSPLAFGKLSGKYLQNPPADGRLMLFSGIGSRYNKPNVDDAIAAYAEIARSQGLTLVQLALAYVRSRWFVGSTIIGATTLDQLQENIDSVNVTLSDAIIQEINAVHQRYPNPAP